MFDRGPSFHARLLCSAAVVTMVAAAGSAAAQDRSRINIEPQPLVSALNAFGVATGQPVISTPELTGSKTSPGVRDADDPAMALTQLLAGTGLSYRCSGDTYLIVPGPQAGPAPARCIVQAGAGGNDGATGTVEALIVTAQKREEDIQDVPIAISAFTQEDLTRSQVAGGPDLMTQVPNMTFTKTNFTSYSIQIRGIGTQAISATTDPAVAVAFNNTPFVRNRFFEQEFYDLQRVEVLRGPQGTLYGRNATAGVVNIISAKPKFSYEAKVSADVANYNSTRLEGMINLPLVEDMVALRIAGAWTKREGFVTNELTGNPIDGRDLWSTRASLRFAPTDWLDVNLIWEHFEEDDDRLRAGKQLCKRHVITEVGGIPVTFLQAVPDYGQSGNVTTNVQSAFSQGCLPSSLYSPDSFQVPNGFALPYATLGSGARDPYASAFQSRDLRVIESTVDPDYRAKSDLVELQFTADLSDSLSLTSETAWAHDFVYGLQDLNRFNTLPGEWGPNYGNPNDIYLDGPDGFSVFCDPQIGCSNRLVAMDLATAKSDHFSQEFRLGSNFDGPFNFSLGANFLRYDTEDKYYVFANKLTVASLDGSTTVSPWVPGVSDNRDCMQGGPRLPDFGTIYQVFDCTYIDPNPFGSLNDRGHNYFLSKNPYKLISYAVFGEAYYNVTDALKITAGLRWTVDKKEAPRIPTWVLGSESVGLAVDEVVEQEWREPTGRLTVDWKPDLTFTDETLLYASYAHGYKAGGANPPPYGIIMFCATCGGTARIVDGVLENSQTQPKTFEPEFIDAFEVGAKNTFLDGSMTLNLAAFYYDYEGYQISQIVNRSAVNLNFDAEVWGLEIEVDWRPLENLRLGFKGGYENTRVADGMQAIDIMDRTAGREGWMVVKPFPTFPSNCILPVELYLRPTDATRTDFTLWGLGGPNGGNPGGCELAYFMGVDPGTEQPYSDPPATGSGAAGFWPAGTYPGFDPSQPDINNGEGFFKDLSGNELPNAPNFTATITADYTIPLPNDWLATLHTDLYYQSEAWTRIFNTEGYDKLKAYTNVNLAAIFTNDEAGWKVMAYVKNVFDRDSITGAFLFSDDTGLTTNVFLTEPRLYGLRVTKEWTGGPWWTGANPDHTGPYPLTVEIGGTVQRQDAPYADLTPASADSFTGELDTAEAQNRDLDWGDGRELRLTYALPGDTWRLGAGYRIGRTNGTDQTLDFVLADEGCGGSTAQCDQAAQYGYEGEPFFFKAYNYSDVTVTNREEHTVIDFDIGRDVGLGMGMESSLRAGLRSAQLESTTHMLMFGASNWDLPEEFVLFKYSSNTHYKSDLTASREFEGFGPTLSWDAAKRLWGSDQAHLDFEWSATGGVLFGKQKTAFDGDETSAYFSGKYFVREVLQSGPTVDISDLPAPRSKSVTAPLLDLSAGLAFEAGRVKVGAGYRWERYFDVLDVGYREHEDADRTIDGPYFKIAVGFGG